MIDGDQLDAPAAKIAASIDAAERSFNALERTASEVAASLPMLAGLLREHVAGGRVEFQTARARLRAAEVTVDPASCRRAARRLRIAFNVLMVRKAAVMAIFDRWFPAAAGVGGE